MDETTYQFNEASLLRQLESVQRAQKLADSLTECAEKMALICPAESATDYMQILSEAESLQRYCSAMTKVVSDMQLELHGLIGTIGTMLEITSAEIRQVAPGDPIV